MLQIASHNVYKDCEIKYLHFLSETYSFSIKNCKLYGDRDPRSNAMSASRYPDENNTDLSDICTILDIRKACRNAL